jgi:triose/dihydroxyacetone kinase / FAD-AMP lyase (cyclizing)
VSGILAIARLVEDTMGGTSGALYSIYLSALAQGVSSQSSQRITLATISSAAEFALQALGKYTPARVGDRTLVDALDPFVRELVAGGGIMKAVAAAKKGYVVPFEGGGG